MVRAGGRRAVIDVELLAVAALGVAVRLRQFMSGRSLWLDEASVANDLAELSLVEALTERSPRNQMAPPGFWAVSHGADAISSDEVMLRLFPLAAGLTIIWLTTIYAVRHIERRAARFLLVAMIALSPSLTHYSSELKQYAGEALLTMMVVFVVAEREKIGRLGAVVFAGVMLAFSIPALLIVPILGVWWLVFEARRRGPAGAIRYLAAPGGVIFAGWISVFTWAQLAKPSIMQGFWTDSFAPLPTGSEQIGWWTRTIVGVSHLTLSNIGIPMQEENPAWITSPTRMIALALWGLILAGGWLAASAVRRHRRGQTSLSPAVVTWIVVVPVVATIIAGFALAAILEVYPFRGRLILFLVPLVAVAGAHGLDVALERQASPTPEPKRMLTTLAGVAAIVVVATAATSAIGLLVDPYDRFDIEPAIAWIAENAEEGDAVVSYFLSFPQTEYYRPHLDDAGLVAEPYFGSLALDAVLDEIGTRPTWFLHGHIRADRNEVEALADHPSVAATFRAESVIALLLEPEAG